MCRTLPLVLLCCCLWACGATTITPLVGEDRQVLELLDAPPPDDPSSSALAAARRLHQALIQVDMELAWTLLAAPTRAALDALGKQSGMSGRELLDASSVPGTGGSLHKANFATLLIGPRAVGLKQVTGLASKDGQADVQVKCADGSEHTRTFQRDDTGWKLLLTPIPGVE
jgi:hypothetical protein